MTTIAIGGIMHESNTFSSVQTGIDAFSQSIGDNLIDEWKDTHHEMGGFIECMESQTYNMHPTLMASATPSGPVTDSAFEKLTDYLIDQFRSINNLNGILLALHGALVVESYPDGDGEILKRLRDCFGESIPIVVTLDHHANVSKQMVDKSTALVIYKTNPHIDQRQRGIQATELMIKILDGLVSPTQALAKPPMILNILYQNTDAKPMKPILDEIRKLETKDHILVGSGAAGYPYADVYEVGPSFVVVTDNDMKGAQKEADRLADLLWNEHKNLTLNLPDAENAVKQALKSDKHPIILVEMGDNIGGGSPGDSTFILTELVKQNASNYVVIICDPECVESCIHAGVGRKVSLCVGGKADKQHGEPVSIQGTVRLIHDGHYIETEPRHGGQRNHHQGLTAVVSVGDSLVVLTSKRQTPFSLHQLYSIGIDPEKMQMIVVKAAIAYRAAYEPIAGKIIEVDTPGLTAVNPLHFNYKNIRSPLFPMD
ncbi:M81 family metallopeptidase [Candidatus Poribacteria bacterium]|nr:M81 family metallopeptidase [Candidatus Poribacteria bacterium]